MWRCPSPGVAERTVEHTRARGQLHLLRNLQQQAEQVPHLSQMARDTLERLNLPRPAAPVEAAQGSAWPLRLLGAALVAGGVSQGLVLAPAAWAAWLSLGAGVALILRR